MATDYRWTHATATAIACGAVGYQTAVIWEMLSGVSLVTKMGVPLATVSAALLPVLAEAAWRGGERTKAAMLVLPVAILMAYVLPSGVSRLGEAQEARVTAATVSQADAARIRADLARADKLVAQAEAWASTECASGPGPKCRGQQFLLGQRQAYQRELSGKLATTQPVTPPWLPSWHPATLPIGLELAIVAALFYGMGPLTRTASRTTASQDVPATIVAEKFPAAGEAIKGITERDFATDPITDEEIEEIKRVLGTQGLMNKQLAQRLGVSEGQSSKLVSAAVASGKLSKMVDPANRRAVLIRATA